MPLTGSKDKPDDANESSRRYARQSNIPPEEMGAFMPVPREETPFLQSYHEAQLPPCPGTRFTNLSEPVTYVRARSVPPPQMTHEQAQLLEKINQNYYLDKNNQLRDRDTGRIVK